MCQVPTEKADALRSEAAQIESSCARDFSINKLQFKQLHSPIKLSVMRNAKENVQCFARCVIDRYGYYLYQNRDFDVDKLVVYSAAQGLTENHTRLTADRCKRIAWVGDEDCEDFWNIYKCFHGSV